MSLVAYQYFSIWRPQLGGCKRLQESVNKSIDRDRYGATSFEEAAILYKREPICPVCESKDCYLDGKTNAGHTRYICKSCDSSYTLLSDSIFNSVKLPLHKLMNYIERMSFNVPLELLCEVLNISSNTAELWCK